MVIYFSVAAYLHSLPPDILRLRLSLLMEGKCDEYALNLSTWLVRLKVFQQDVDILQKHLVLLLKQGMKDQFHKKVCFSFLSCEETLNAEWLEILSKFDETTQLK
jgi:hypothetical protein